MAALFVDREFYRSSVRADWGKLLVGDAGIVALAALGAVLAFFVYNYIYHLMVIMPLAAGVILGILGEHNVARSGCCNRWIAAAGGLTAGCLFFFGTYYVELLWLLGWRALGRVDLIPRLIAWHLENDVIFAHFHQQRQPDAGQNGFLLAIEFLCAVGPAVALPFKRAGQVYCEGCGKWAESLSTTVSFAAGESIVAAINQEQLNELPEFPTIPADVSKKNSVPCTLITLEHCPDAAENGCLVYLSLRRFPKDSGRGRVRVKRLEIDQLETLRLMFKIPGLRGVDGSGSELEPDGRPPEVGEDPTASADPMATA